MTRWSEGMFHVKQWGGWSHLKKLPPRRLPLPWSAMVGWLLVSLFLGSACSAQYLGWSGPVVEGNVLYAVSTQGQLLAVELPPTGMEKWKFPANKEDGALGGVYDTPFLTDNTLYVGSYTGKILALDAATGAKRWEFTTGGPIIGRPIVAQGVVLAGSSDGKLYALNAENGEPRWAPFKAEAAIWGSPAVAEGKVFFGTLGHRFYALNLSDGTLAWEPFQTKGAVASTPVVVEGTVYFGASDSAFYALDAATGQPRWAQPFKARNWFWTQALVRDGVIYVGSLDHLVYAIDAKTGTARWREPFVTNGPVRTPPLLVDDTLLVASNDTRLYFLDPKTGAEKRSLFTDDAIQAPLFLTQDKVYLSTTKQSVYSWDRSSGEWRKVLPQEGTAK